MAGGAEKSLAAIPAARSTREKPGGTRRNKERHRGNSGASRLSPTRPEPASPISTLKVRPQSRSARQPQRPAVPRVASTCSGRPGGGVRRTRSELQPRGGTQADPQSPRRRSISRHRFLLEAEITGGLEHPGIVPVYGLGAYADGRPYYAMRFIRGESLKEAIGRFHAERKAEERPRLAGRWNFASCCAGSWTSATRSTTPIRGACSIATSSRRNIILGKHGETLVVDWGLAKATGKGDASAGERTMTPARPAAVPRPCRVRPWARPPT